MSIIIIYTDFDGTITEKPGGNVVFTEFYQSLLRGYKEGVRQDYKRTPMKELSEIHSIFEAKFGKYNENFQYKQKDISFLMNPNAVKFFHKILRNPDIAVNIVTKNRVEYIKAVFRYQGFSDAEINQLTIFDSGDKFFDVNSQLAHQKDKANRIYILDDSEAEYIEMFRAVKNNGYNEKEIRGYNKKSGQFAWIQYLKYIEEIVPLLVSYEETVGGGALKENSLLMNRNKPNLSSNYYILKMMTIWAGIGFTAGLGIGFNLAETGMLGINRLGVLAVGALIAVGCGVLSSVIGFDIAKGIESKLDESQKENSVNENKHEFTREPHIRSNRPTLFGVRK